MTEYKKFSVMIHFEPIELEVEAENDEIARMIALNKCEQNEINFPEVGVVENAKEVKP